MEHERRQYDSVLSEIKEAISGTREAVARLEAKHDSFSKELLGNGQPGRVGKLEDDVDALKSKLSYFTGAFSGLGLLLGVAEAWLHGIFKTK